MAGLCWAAPRAVSPPRPDPPREGSPLGKPPPPRLPPPRDGADGALPESGSSLSVCALNNRHTQRHRYARTRTHTHRTKRGCQDLWFNLQGALLPIWGAKWERLGNRMGDHQESQGEASTLDKVSDLGKFTKSTPGSSPPPGSLVPAGSSST